MDDRLTQQVEWGGIQRREQNPAFKSCFDGFQVQHRDTLRISSPPADWNAQLASLNHALASFASTFKRQRQAPALHSPAP
jgi:hypothetical protein